MTPLAAELVPLPWRIRAVSPKIGTILLNRSLVRPTVATHPALISPSDFRDLVGGRRRGPAAALLRGALRAASLPYGWAVAWRNRRYDRRAAEVLQASVPVVSIGNLTVGGTGKTPMVLWLARKLRDRGVRVAILSRGYRAAEDGRNDEALEMELALPDVPHLQNADRSASALVATDELGMQLLLLDDGFQHRRLARDLDVVLLDASQPFGYDRLLPAGLLREPATGLRRADAVVLSRCEMLEAAAREAIRIRVAQIAPRAVWCEAAHRPAALVDSTGERRAVEELSGATTAAFCGIGNPAGFRHSLERLRCKIVAWRELPDHHAYDRQCVEQLAEFARTSGARIAVCTMKDLVKLRTNTLGGLPLVALAVEMELRVGEAELLNLLEPLVQRALAVELLE